MTVAELKERLSELPDWLEVRAVDDMGLSVPVLRVDQGNAECRVEIDIDFAELFPDEE